MEPERSLAVALLGGVSPVRVYGVAVRLFRTRTYAEKKNQMAGRIWKQSGVILRRNLWD